METASILVNIEKTEAFKIGSPKFGVLEIPITDELLAPLTEEERTYVASLWGGKFPKPGRLPSVSPLTVPPNFTTADVVSAIKLNFELVRKEQEANQIEEQKRKEQAKIKEEAARNDLIQEVLTASDDEIRSWTRLNYNGSGWYGTLNPDHYSVQDDPQVMARIDPIIAAMITRKKAEEEAKLAQKKAEEEARELQKAKDKEVFAAYVLEHGTENQKSRFAAGRLPEKEILEVRKTELFPQHFPKYQFLTQKDIDCGDRHYDHTPISKFTSSEYKGEVSAEAWDQYESIKKEVLASCPEAKIEIREHQGWCAADECPGKVTYRYSVRCSVTWAGHELIQNYAIDN